MLTVTDNDGDSDTDTQSVDMPVAASQITLTANGYKVKGIHHVDLTWSGASTDNVDIFKDSVLLTTVPNPGFYTDNTEQKGGASYTYQLCEANSTVCSDPIDVVF